MLSRVAEAVYWTGRYIERAENTARFIDVNLQMSLDAPSTFSEQWEPAIAVTGDRAPFFERYEAATRQNVIQFLTFDRDNPNSIVTCLTRARENARSIREIISSEMWEQINRFYLVVGNRAAAKRALGDDSSQFFGDVKLLSHLITGVADNTMAHGEAWHFFHLGRLLERADNTTRLLDVKYFLLLPSVEHVGGAVDEMQWSILLRSASALEMYRKTHGRISPDHVIDFLILDSEFPRAVLFCLRRAEESLSAVSFNGNGRKHNAAERRLGQLRSELAYAQVNDIIGSGLHEYLDSLQSKLKAVANTVSETFFASQVSEVKAEQREGRQNGDVLFGYQGQRGPGRHRRHTRNFGQ